MPKTLPYTHAIISWHPETIRQVLYLLRARSVDQRRGLGGCDRGAPETDRVRGIWQTQPSPANIRLFAKVSDRWDRSLAGTKPERRGSPLQHQPTNQLALTPTT